MQNALSSRRLSPARSVALAALIAIGAFFAISGAARAADAVTVSGFTLTPAAPTAASSPDIGASMNFAYTSATEASVQNVAVTLPPGLLAAPAAIAAAGQCTPTQLSTQACPTSSLIGTGTGTTSLPAATGANNLTANIYLLPSTSTSEVAEIGVEVGPTPASGATFKPIASSSASPVTLAFNSKNQPQLTMNVKGLPTTVPNPTPGGAAIPFQLNSLSVTINGKSPSGTAFTREPSSCAAGTASVSVDTANTTGAGTATATSTPTGCSALTYAPALAAAGAKDAADSGVTVSTSITQAATEATSSKVSLAIPSNVSANLTAAAGDLCTSATYVGCTAVGAAQANSPLLPAALTGKVYLTGSLTTPMLTIAFPAPFALTMNGAIGITTNTVAFSNVPDVPLTQLLVSLTGGPTGLFTTTCNPVTSTATANFVSQNGDLTKADTAPFTVTGCPAATTTTTTTTTPPPTKTPGKPTLKSGSLSGVASGKATLSFKVAAGNNGAAKVSGVTVKAPSGTSFVKAGLKKGVTVSGGKAKSVTIKGGKLVVTLKSGVASFSVKVKSSALKVSAGLKSKVKAKKTKSVTLSLSVKNTAGKSVTVSKSLKV